MMSGQFCPHCLSEIRGLLLEELCFPKTTVNLEGKEMQKSSASCRNKLLLEIARPLTQNHVDCLLCHCLFTHCRHILFSLGTRPPAHLLQLIESFSCLLFFLASFSSFCSRWDPPSEFSFVSCPFKRFE